MSIAEIFETMEYGPAPESASPAMKWLDERDRTMKHFIDGEWREPGDGERFDTTNPANAGVLARIAQGSREDVDAAVRAASRVRLFVNATSLGGTESLLEHRASSEGAGSPTPQNLLRVSVGLEHPDDLIEDFAQASEE